MSQRFILMVTVPLSSGGSVTVRVRRPDMPTFSSQREAEQWAALTGTAFTRVDTEARRA